jgi:hypothetical protein
MRGHHHQRAAAIRRRRITAVLAVAAAGAALALLLPGRASAKKRAGPPTTVDRVVPTTTTVPPTTVPPPFEPASIRPLINPPLADEGQWTEADTWDAGPPAILTTTFRPDPTQPGVTAYAAWIRTSGAQLALYPGYKGPGPTGLDRGPEMVPAAARTSLLATFNSGFYEADSAGGFYTHGTLYFPMIDGLATVVAYRDSRVDVIDWTGGPDPGPDVVMARQNLPLIVDGGEPTPSLDTSFKWGVTLHGALAVWRTALGVDAEGNLIYLAAPNQTAPTLARALVEAGAVRGMELDINPAWPIFVTYGGPGAASPALFVPNPNQVPNRFLYSSTKDFFAVYVRSAAAAGPPW